jgi:hypothetical protein
MQRSRQTNVRAMPLRGRSGVLRTEPIFVVSALRAPAAIAKEEINGRH